MLGVILLTTEISAFTTKISYLTTFFNYKLY
jgi:hypothetical protein